MKKTAILLFILLAFISCKDEITVITSKQPGKIVGTVLPKEAIATVQLLQGEVISTTLTTNGIFQFEDVSPGIYRLSIKADDLGKQIINNIKVEDGEGNDIGVIQLSKYPYPLISTSPFDGQKETSTNNGQIRLVFNENIDPSSLYEALKIEPKLIIERFYFYNNQNFTFYTTFNFGTEYKVTIDTSVITEYGEHLEFPATFTFNTINFKLAHIYYPYFSRYGNDPLELAFNGTLLQDFENIVTIEPNISIEISSFNSSRMRISPTFGWMADTTFNITISKLLEEINGATLESDTTISFTTPKLEIVETFPLNNQYYIDTTSVIRVVANYTLDERTIKNAVTISPNVDFQISTYTRNDRTEFLLFPTHLNPNTEYTITIDQSLTDFYGVPLREDYIFSFTTKE